MEFLLFIIEWLMAFPIFHLVFNGLISCVVAIIIYKVVMKLISMFS